MVRYGSRRRLHQLCAVVANLEKMMLTQRLDDKVAGVQDLASSTFRCPRPARVAGLRKDGRDFDQLAGIVATPLDHIKGSREHTSYVLPRHFDVVPEQGNEGIPVEAADDGRGSVELRR